MLLIFFAAILNYCLRAIQQLNVVRGQKWLVTPTSMAIAIFEVLVITQVSRDGTLWSAIPLGLGGGIGCLIAMWLHEKLAGKQRSHQMK